MFIPELCIINEVIWLIRKHYLEVSFSSKTISSLITQMTKNRDVDTLPQGPGLHIVHSLGSISQ